MLAYSVDNDAMMRGGRRVSHDKLLNELNHALRDVRNGPPDFTVICGNDRHMVHQRLLSKCSRFFQVASQGHFKEATSRTLYMHDDNAQALKMLLYYAYTHDYPRQAHTAPELLPGWKRLEVTPGIAPQKDGDDAAGNEQEEDDEYGPLHDSAYKRAPNLTLHGRVYALAEKYAIPGLKDLCVRKFQAEAIRFHESADFVRASVEAYHIVVEEDREFKDAVCDVILRYRHELLRPEREKVTLSCDGLARDIRQRLREESNGLAPVAPY